MEGTNRVAARPRVSHHDREAHRQRDRGAIKLTAAARWDCAAVMLGFDELIQDGVIEGGMLPKVEASARAVKGGVKGAYIVDGRLPNALLHKLFTHTGLGTEVVLLASTRAVPLRREARHELRGHSPSRVS